MSSVSGSSSSEDEAEAGCHDEQSTKRAIRMGTVDGGNGNAIEEISAEKFQNKSLRELEASSEDRCGNDEHSPKGATSMETVDAIKKSIASRTQSHRKVLEVKILGSKAKQLTLKQLSSIQKECERELPESDKLNTLLQDLVTNRSTKRREPLVESLNSSRSKNYTVKHWKTLLEKCQNELPKSDELVKKALKGLENRQKTHRVPLANAVDEADRLSLRKLDLLERKCSLELSEDDSLLAAIKECIKRREKSHKEPMVAEYTKMMNSKSLKQISIVKYSKFLKIVEKELPADDSFVTQVKTAQEAIVQNKLDPGKASGKTISRRSRTKKTRENKSQNYDVEIAVAESKSHSETNVIVSFITAVREDMSGIHDSNMYKLILVILFVVYSGLMFYTMQLTQNVAPITWDTLFSSEMNAPENAVENMGENVAAGSGLD